jgi:drug/metabolite transporter (DMT)-like permease
MTLSDLTRLIALAAIWGASFLFIRIVAPVLGPFWTAEARVALAGAAMLVFMAANGHRINLRLHGKHYLVLGLLTCAIPFSLFAYAALTLPAGYLAIINATSPMWGALIGAVLLNERLTGRKIVGLGIGIAGVALLMRLGPVPLTPQLLLSVLACTGAAICYSLAGAYTKRVSARLSPLQMATGSQLGAALLLLPLLPLAPIRAVPTPGEIAVLLALALVCSAVAYVLYFRLIASVGPTRALTVTFLIPLFALFWGALFLNEPITANMLAGCTMVVVATWLVVFQRPAPVMR